MSKVWTYVVIAHLDREYMEINLYHFLYPYIQHHVQLFAIKARTSPVFKAHKAEQNEPFIQ